MTHSEMRYSKPLLALALRGLVAAGALAQTAGAPPQAAQNPSPMLEHTRKHERIANHNLPGLRFTITEVLPTPVAVFLPQKHFKEKQLDLLLHFHGAAFLVENAATNHRGPLVAASVNLGAGSIAYDRAFADSTRFPALVDTVRNILSTQFQHAVSFRRVVISGIEVGAIGDATDQPRTGATFRGAGLCRKHRTGSC